MGNQENCKMTPDKYMERLRSVAHRIGSYRVVAQRTEYSLGYVQAIMGKQRIPSRTFLDALQKAYAALDDVEPIVIPNYPKAVRPVTTIEKVTSELERWDRSTEQAHSIAKRLVRLCK